MHMSRTFVNTDLILWNLPSLTFFTKDVHDINHITICNEIADKNNCIAYCNESVSDCQSWWLSDQIHSFNNILKKNEYLPLWSK